MELGPITLIVICGGVAVALFVYGMYLLAVRRRDVLAQRVEAYAGIEEEAALATAEEMSKLGPFARVMHTILGRGYIERLEDNLTRADLPMRASEYILLRFVLAGVGFLIGYYGLRYVHSGIILAVIGLLLPAVFVRVHQNRRRAKFVRQLANALMLLTNSLRSGYSFLKGLELVAKEMDDPISKELSRTLREINLGATVDEALLNLGRRVNSQDMDIVISAFLVQKDIGGNLTEIMEKVAETIRERLRIQGDIKVLTAQGRLSGLIVGLLPVFVFFIIFLTNPGYFNSMFADPKVNLLGGLEAPMGLLLLIGAVSMQVFGGYLIFRIISIKV